jgi:hypothetical protein
VLAWAFTHSGNIPRKNRMKPPRCRRTSRAGRKYPVRFQGTAKRVADAPQLVHVHETGQQVADVIGDVGALEPHDVQDVPMAEGGEEHPQGMALRDGQGHKKSAGRQSGGTIVATRRYFFLV